MRIRHFILGGVLILLVAGVAWRWPRLDPDVVAATRAEFSGDQMVVEYRMSRRFEAAIGHGIRKPVEWSGGPSIRFGRSTQVRRERVVVIRSKYDLLRGEHYVRLVFRRGPPLTIVGGDRSVDVEPWSVADASQAKWLPPSGRYGGGIGHDIVHLAASAEQEEYVIIYAGAGVGHYVE